MTYKPRRERRAEGGKAGHTQPLHTEHWNQYNAKGAPEDKEESEKPDGFKRGGRMKKRKEGGEVSGDAATHHLGKRARGGATAHRKGSGFEDKNDRNPGEDGKEKSETPHRKRGGHVGGHKRASGGATPFSHGHNLTPPGNDKKTGPGEDADTIP